MAEIKVGIIAGTGLDNQDILKERSVHKVSPSILLHPRHLTSSYLIPHPSLRALSVCSHRSAPSSFVITITMVHDA